MSAPDYAPLFYWVREREAIRLRKEVDDQMGVSLAPLTDDPILATYRFCNVRREDDRVTVWIRKNIREKFAGNRRLWFMLCIARQINWPDTLYDLMTIHPGAWPAGIGEFDPTFLTMALNHRKNVEKKKLYTGAYMISAPHTKGADKQAYIAEEVLGALWTHRAQFDRYLAQEPPFAPTIQGMHERLSSFNGWGPFMAYQAVGDMIFTPILENAADKEVWCAAGPGTLRGLNRLYGRDVLFTLPQDRARAEIRAIWKVIREETGVDMAFNDVPNCLCETDKYLRVKNGEGKPRALYVPGRGS